MSAFGSYDTFQRTTSLRTMSVFSWIIRFRSPSDFLIVPSVSLTSQWDNPSKLWDILSLQRSVVLRRHAVLISRERQCESMFLVCFSILYEMKQRKIVLALCRELSGVPLLHCLRYLARTTFHRFQSFGGLVCWAMPVHSCEIAIRDRAFPTVQQFQVLISRGC